MSWIIQIPTPGVNGADFAAAIDSARVDPAPGAVYPIADTYPSLDEHVAAQVEHVKELAKTAVASGHFGDPNNCVFTAVLSGHANPGGQLQDAASEEQGRPPADYFNLSIKQYTEA